MHLELGEAVRNAATFACEERGPDAVRDGTKAQIEARRLNLSVDKIRAGREPAAPKEIEDCLRRQDTCHRSPFVIAARDAA